MFTRTQNRISLSPIPSLLKIRGMERNEAEEFYGVPCTVSTPQFPTSYKPILTSSLLNVETTQGLERYSMMANLDHSQGLHNTNPCHYSHLLLPKSSIQIPDHKSSNASSNSNNNISDDAKALLDDRKKKRMFSNRESARRSRMRKKQQIESLQFQVDLLQNMNHQLSQKLIYLLECNQQILEQNGQLKEKLSSLQAALSNLLVPGTNAEAAGHMSNGLFAELSAPALAFSGS